MKFAKSLLHNQVPQWSASYMDYKGLKKQIKQAAEECASQESGSAAADEALAPFFYDLDRNAELVDAFFNSKYAEYSRRLQLASQAAKKKRHLEQEELDDFLNVLLDLRAQFRRLQWYAEINKRGFVKILKKLDKKIGTNTQARYLASKINVLAFASVQEPADRVAQINAILAEIAPHADLCPPDADLRRTETGQRPFYDMDNPSAPRLFIEDGLTPFRRSLELDNREGLEKAYREATPTQRENISLLLNALSNQRNRCIPLILRNCQLLQDPGELNNRNVIHRLVITRGRAASDRRVHLATGLSLSKAPNDLLMPGPAKDQQPDGSELSLDLLAQNLSVDQRPAITAADQQLRTPLHYAAIYGQPHLVKLLLHYANSWGFLTKLGICSREWRDSEGASPLNLAIAHNHPSTARTLLDYGVPPNSDTVTLVNPLVLAAARIDSPSLVRALVEFGCDINYQSPDTHETALYVSAKCGFVDTIEVLCEMKANVELREKTFGWSPLFVAAVDGNIEIAKLLLAAGASPNGTDSSGWTAKEHAALRGHIELSRLFPAAEVEESPPLPPQTTTDKLNGKKLTGDAFKQRKSIPNYIKTFGHRYLQDPTKCLILVTLGSKDLRFQDGPVNLNLHNALDLTELDAALSLRVSASNVDDTQETLIDLPVPELGLATEPITFTSENPESVQIFFDLVPTSSAAPRLVGRAVALLSCLANKVGGVAGLHNLNDTHTVPILEVNTLKLLGSVTFETLVVRPFAHPKVGIQKSSTYWKSLITSRVIGHRGLGKNTLAKTSLQLGENTVESFIQAASLGASYVEFDVQLTKDRVPVVYHDFVVNDSGFDIPMHQLTLEQFLNIHNRPQKQVQDDQNSILTPKRSFSIDGKIADMAELDDTLRRLRLTRDYKLKGFKGNQRGSSIQSRFATLEELFKKLPQSVGFNVECKYPMRDECEAENLESVVIDINEWVDTLLEFVYDHKGERDIIFSSFCPDVCILLSLKQPSIPVLFLTEAGTEQMMDVRASSLQEAIRFAKRWNLLGIVSESTPLVDCPRLVKAVKELGLCCFTYGTLNNSPDLARKQLRAGVDAVIVDSVLAVRAELCDADLQVDFMGIPHQLVRSESFS